MTSPASSAATDLLCLDVGSTYTKAARVTAGGHLVGTAETPTSVGTDVLDGCRVAAGGLAAADLPWLVCSSAGGGLRLAVVGYEREVTAEAGRRVGLSAGARVVHVSSGPLDAAGVRALRADRPDIVLLVGGTDGGNSEVLLHNAARLASARVSVPVVVAGNRHARDEVAARLASTSRRVVLADNVVPRIGVIAPDSARAAIRAAFLEHVIGGKGLSRGGEFARLVRMATPDAVLQGVETLAEAFGHDVLVVDVGGATTDVYSSVTPAGEDAVLRREVVAPLRHARTVEADLGMRWNAEGAVEAAASERIPVSAELPRYGVLLAGEPRHLPGSDQERGLDLELARVAAVVATRRHGRPGTAGETPRPLAEVRLVVGSGGVLRHAAPGDARTVLDAVLSDHAGGWRVPRHARVTVDSSYLLFAVGLLADDHPDAALRLASALTEPPARSASRRSVPQPAVPQ